MAALAPRPAAVAKLLCVLVWQVAICQSLSTEATTTSRRLGRQLGHDPDGGVVPVIGAPLFSPDLHGNLTRRRLQDGTCEFDLEANYGGYDLAGTATCGYATTGSPDECCSLCVQTHGCLVWTWYSTVEPRCPNSCWLKSASGERTQALAAVSGFKGATPPPEPTPPPPEPTTPPPEPTTPPPVDGLGGSFGGGQCIDEEATLGLHNQLRARHEGTPPMSWAPDLAASAQAFAESLSNCDVLYHSYTAGVGENIGSGYSSVGIWGVPRTCADTVQLWYNEVGGYDWANPVGMLGDFGKLMTIGHFTQVVWKSSVEVGCGIAPCTSNQGFQGEMVVCHYRASGNSLDPGTWLANVGVPV